MFSKGLTRPVDTAGDRGVGLVSFISLFVNNINGGPSIFNVGGGVSAESTRIEAP